MDKNSEKVSVLIVDDQSLVREGIASILKLYEDLEICAVAANGEEAVRAARKYHPAVILMDIRMPVMNGIDAAAKILAEKTAGAIIMLTTFDDEEYIVKALKTGASGYFMKDLPSDELHQAILAASRGGFQSTTTIMEKLQSVIGSGNNDASRYGGAGNESADLLSPRESEVLKCIGQGFTNSEIAGELGLSEGTVRNYVSAILDTMGFRDRIQAALFASRFFQS